MFSQNRRDGLFFSANEPTIVTTKDSSRHGKSPRTVCGIIDVVCKKKCVYFCPETSAFLSASVLRIITLKDRKLFLNHLE